jgi:uncharacterized membrane protein YdjX (TVP38/TMEM64 family)
MFKTRSFLLTYPGFCVTTAAGSMAAEKERRSTDGVVTRVVVVVAWCGKTWVPITPAWRWRTSRMRRGAERRMKIVEIMAFAVVGGGGAVVELFLLEIMTKEEDELPRTTTARKREKALLIQSI